MKSNHHKRIKQGICAYCGTIDRLTRDHIVPRCLWDTRTAEDVIPMVDACQKCNNNMKSKDDAYLRDVLVNDQDSFQHEMVQRIRLKFEQAARNGQSLMNDDFQLRGKVVYTQQPSQLFVPRYVSEIADRRVKGIIEQMVRGLHQYYLEKRLPKDSTFWTGRLHSETHIEEMAKDIAGYTSEHHRGGFAQVGKGSVFSCGYVELSATEHMTLWQLVFYDSVVFGVLTNAVQVTKLPSS